MWVLRNIHVRSRHGFPLRGQGGVNHQSTKNLTKN